MKVIKRDKTLEVFQFSKIENAITKAFESVGQQVSEDVINCMREKYDENLDVDVDVEDIQDAIELLGIETRTLLCFCLIMFVF